MRRGSTYQNMSSSDSWPEGGSETSGEIFGCSLEELRDAIAVGVPEEAKKQADAPSPLESLRRQVHTQGHPDFL